MKTKRNLCCSHTHRHPDIISMLLDKYSSPHIHTLSLYLWVFVCVHIIKLLLIHLNKNNKFPFKKFSFYPIWIRLIRIYTYPSYTYNSVTAYDTLAYVRTSCGDAARLGWWIALFVVRLCARKTNSLIFTLIASSQKQMQKCLSSTLVKYIQVLTLPLSPNLFFRSIPRLLRSHFIVHVQCVHVCWLWLIKLFLSAIMKGLWERNVAWKYMCNLH